MFLAAWQNDVLLKRENKRHRRSISDPGFRAELRTSAINGSSPDVHEDEDSSSEGAINGSSPDGHYDENSSSEGAVNGSSPDGHYDENSSSEGVEKILEDGFGFKVHNLQDSDSSSSSTCLKEPDFVVTCVARNDEEYSSRSDLQVSVIESPEIGLLVSEKKL